MGSAEGRQTSWTLSRGLCLMTGCSSCSPPSDNENGAHCSDHYSISHTSFVGQRLLFSMWPCPSVIHQKDVTALACSAAGLRFIRLQLCWAAWSSKRFESKVPGVTWLLVLLLQEATQNRKCFNGDHHLLYSILNGRYCAYYCMVTATWGLFLLPRDVSVLRWCRRALGTTTVTDLG